MADQHGRSVRELLPEKFERMDEVVRDRLVREPGMDSAGIPGFLWHVAGTRATEAVRKTLDCDTFGLLARAWAKARELLDYADATKHAPEKEITVFLGEHELVTNVHPVIEVSVAGYGRTQLRFTLELAAEFRSAELRIKGGKIVAIGAGDCAVSAQLKYDDVDLHDKLKSSELKLSEPHALTPALPITRQ